MDTRGETVYFEWGKGAKTGRIRPALAQAVFEGWKPSSRSKQKLGKRKIMIDKMGFLCLNDINIVKDIDGNLVS